MTYIRNPSNMCILIPYYAEQIIPIPAGTGTKEGDLCNYR